VHFGDGTLTTTEGAVQWFPLLKDKSGPDIYLRDKLIEPFKNLILYMAKNESYKMSHDTILDLEEYGCPILDNVSVDTMIKASQIAQCVFEEGIVNDITTRKCVIGKFPYKVDLKLDITYITYKEHIEGEKSIYEVVPYVIPFEFDFTDIRFPEMPDYVFDKCDPTVIARLDYTGAVPKVGFCKIGEFELKTYRDTMAIIGAKKDYNYKTATREIIDNQKTKILAMVFNAMTPDIRRRFMLDLLKRVEALTPMYLNDTMSQTVIRRMLNIEI
jgi:hypothetical protein